MSPMRLAIVALLLSPSLWAQAGRPAQPAPAGRPGAFSRAAFNDPANKKPPFDLTGTWYFGIRNTKSAQFNVSTGGFEFMPLPKLTTAAQAEWDAKEKANREGKTYKDDAGACYPPGMPRFMTRVWPFQIIQTPKVIIMIVGLFNRVRWIYLDGRPHADPELTELTYNGDSVGHWEDDTLVVETVNLEPSRHWMQQGVPMSDKLRIVERIRMMDAETFEVQSTFTDPVNWEGEWKTTKRYDLAEDREITENHCLPNTNDLIPGAQPGTTVR